MQYPHHKNKTTFTTEKIGTNLLAISTPTHETTDLKKSLILPFSFQQNSTFGCKQENQVHESVSISTSLRRFAYSLRAKDLLLWRHVGHLTYSGDRDPDCLPAMRSSSAGASVLIEEVVELDARRF